MKLCTCNNCGNIYEDINPQEGAKEYEYQDVEPLVKCFSLNNNKPDVFWGCPVCGTDDFLSDAVDAELKRNADNLSISNIRIYGINANEFEGRIFELTNNDFVHVAEEQGNVWSLEGFESAFNSEEIPYDMFIRFIDPVNEQL